MPICVYTHTHTNIRIEISERALNSLLILGEIRNY